ncbi:PKD domain-containing protein [Agaribacter flavus]|uniref:PKD/Chitinase domain-containing protein n=1 Tax=Agaribacter flavus TaxID=1902781 RepID=A0ABV7FTL8_9ALTE
MSYFKKSIHIIFLICCSLYAYSGDEPVNCRDVIVEEKNIYGGLAQCEAIGYDQYCEPTENGNIVTREPRTVFLSREYERHDRETVTLQKLVVFNFAQGAGPGACSIPTTINSLVSCSAKLDFLGKELIRENRCDYTPQASISVTQNPSSPVGHNPVVISSSGSSDRDGSIVSYKWHIDGVYAGSSASLQRVVTEYDGGTINIQLEVTDNDGYTDSVSSTVYLKPWKCPRNCVTY